MSVRKTMKKKQIVEVAKELFLKHGLKRVSIGEICAQAEVSKATFYKYFSNKDDLLDQIREMLMDTGFVKFDEISKLDIPYPEKIKQMSIWRMTFFKSLEGEFLDELLDIKEFKSRYMERFIKNIIVAQERGEIRKDISPKLIAIVVEKMGEITRENTWRSIFDDYATYQDQLRNLLFYGMLENEK